MARLSYLLFFMKLLHAEHLPKDRPWIIKAGFDPTSCDLHLGHAVLLKQLRQWQNEGHVVRMVVGDFTAQIGDPTGRNSQRPVLDADTIAQNAQTYLDQAYLILNPERTEVFFNSEWLGNMSAQQLLSLMQQFTVAQMTARKDFAQRLNDGVPVGLHELMYPVLQGFDSVHLKADVEIGGEDQLFNVMSGRWMQQASGQAPQAVALMPLLVGLDGVKKMSKSLGNHVGLTDSPIDMFGKVMRVDDGLMRQWSEVLGLVLPEDTPYQQKKQLAHDVVAWLHGLPHAQMALQDWETRFSMRLTPQEAPAFVTPPDTPLDALLVVWGFASSLTEARQKIKEGAVRVNGQKITDKTFVVTDEIVTLGRRLAGKIQYEPTPTDPSPGAGMKRGGA